MLYFVRSAFLIAVIFNMLLSPLFGEGYNDKILPGNLSLSFNGKFIRGSYGYDSKINSENGVFWCQYDIGYVSDEIRELRDFRLFENGRLLFTIKHAPGSDLYISNSGITAFIDFVHHYRNEITIHFYSKTGNHLFSESFSGAILMGFSPEGDKFGVGTTRGLNIVSVLDQNVEFYEKGFQFDISKDENLVAVAAENRIVIYSNAGLLREIITDLAYTRRIRISSTHNIIVVIDKRHLKVYSLSDGRLLFADSLEGKLSYRDLILEKEKIFAGIHYRDYKHSRGILRIFDLQGNIILEEEMSCRDIQSPRAMRQKDESILNYEELPWPFSPFDSMCTVWNYYEQHMSNGDPSWSYLHQGLDLITSIGEPTFAVKEGFVKCVLTIGGESYWRIAISPEQTADYSTGWLYAHLIESSIQFDVGDTVEVYDYLGDIIEWTEEWGHIHFVEIGDSGRVWRYDDDEWGITYNPLLSLRPDTDSIPPVIEDVFDYSRFAFCINETSTYLHPDSLYGDIDIIVKIVDYIGDSSWQQPAFETYYWVNAIADADTVFPRTLGQILNHAYDFYGSNHYEPYATVIYKRDEFLLPPIWMDTLRNFYHILTNNNGDSLIELSERELAFSTSDYPDGEYRIFVEALDEYGNSTIDSMDVQFQNGIVGVSDHQGKEKYDFGILSNYPNPFNNSTIIDYNLPEATYTVINIYNILGDKVETLISGDQHAGYHQVIWDASDYPSSLYFYRIQAGEYIETRKMVLLK